jgi:hypothetical protein
LVLFFIWVRFWGEVADGNSQDIDYQLHLDFKLGFVSQFSCLVQLRLVGNRGLVQLAAPAPMTNGRMGGGWGCRGGLGGAGERSFSLCAFAKTRAI